MSFWGTEAGAGGRVGGPTMAWRWASRRPRRSTAYHVPFNSTKCTPRPRRRARQRPKLLHVPRSPRRPPIPILLLAASTGSGSGRPHRRRDRGAAPSGPARPGRRRPASPRARLLLLVPGLGAGCPGAAERRAQTGRGEALPRRGRGAQPPPACSQPSHIQLGERVMLPCAGLAKGEDLNPPALL